MLLPEIRDRYNSVPSLCLYKPVRRLQEAGYNTYPNPQLQNRELLPDKSVVNVHNISIEKNQIVFYLNLKVPTISPSDKAKLRDQDDEKN